MVPDPEARVMAVEFMEPLVWGRPGTDTYREAMRRYMRDWRRGRLRRPHVAKPMRPRFRRPGHCSNCGHVWPEGSR